MINDMKIYLGADHGGFELKEELKGFLSELGYEVEDMGANTKDEGDDYPDFIIPLAEKVVYEERNGDKPWGEEFLGIVLGRSGNGEAIAANKVKGARAALCTNVEMARKAREHNNANILSIGADYVDENLAKEMIKVFLETSFSGEERHKRRLEKIYKHENS